MTRLIRSFTQIINYKTLIITGLAIISTYICFKYGWTARFPDMLVGVAIVFPVVFSIGSAFSRRETALQRYSDFNGHAIAIYYASRDWSSEKQSDLPQRTRNLIKEMVEMLRVVFNSKNRPEWRANERKCMSCSPDYRD